MFVKCDVKYLQSTAGVTVSAATNPQPAVQNSTRGQTTLPGKGLQPFASRHYLLESLSLGVKFHAFNYLSLASTNPHPFPCKKCLGCWNAGVTPGHVTLHILVLSCGAISCSRFSRDSARAWQEEFLSVKWPEPFCPGRRLFSPVPGFRHFYRHVISVTSAFRSEFRNAGLKNNSERWRVGERVFKL